MQLLNQHKLLHSSLLHCEQLECPVMNSLAVTPHVGKAGGTCRSTEAEEVGSQVQTFFKRNNTNNTDCNQESFTGDHVKASTSIYYFRFRTTQILNVIFDKHLYLHTRSITVRAC